MVLRDWLAKWKNRFRVKQSGLIRRRKIILRDVPEGLEVRELLSAVPVIIDNGDPGYYDVRSWQDSSSMGYDSDIATAANTEAGALASWTFTGLENGQYYLQATWTPGNDRASNATFTARSEFGASGRNFSINQRLNPTADDLVNGTSFQTLGVVTVRDGSLTVELTNSYADGVVVADAVRLEPVLASDNSVEVRTERLDAITKALFAFQGVYNHLPPFATPSVMDANGKFPLSWRVHLLPFLGYDDLYHSFHLNEPWDSPHNLTLLDQMPDVFRSLDLAAGSGMTGFQRIDVPGGFHITGAGGPNSLYGDITDNPATSLLLLELSADKALPWTAPDDVPYSPLDPLASIAPTPAGFMLAAMADGHVQRLNPNISAEDFHALVTWSGGEILSADRRDDIFLPSTLSSDQISQNHLRAIFQGMDNFRDYYGSFPPGEVPLYQLYYDINQNPYLSWRVHILRFIGETSLYNKFHLDEPWDSPNNLPLAALMPEIYRSVGVASGSSVTGYQILNGPGAYDTHGNSHLSPSRDVSDGITDTLALIELPASAAKIWTRPDGDIPFDAADPFAGISPIPEQGLWAITFDQHVHKISPSITSSNLAALATWAGGEILGAIELSNAFLDYPAPESISVRRNNLSNIGYAFLEYQQIFSSFPVSWGLSNQYDVDGNPLLSWRVYLLPYLGYENLFSQFHFDEAWNSPHNLTLLDKMPDVFRSRGLPVGTTLTGFQLLKGPDAFQQKGFSYDHNTSYGPSVYDMTDGPESTILVLETQASDAVEWTRPDGDISFDLAHPLDNIDLTGLENVPGDGLLVLMADGNVKTVQPDISPQDFAALVTWKQGEIIDAAEKGRSFFDYGGSLLPTYDEYKASWLALRSIGYALYNYHNDYYQYPISNVASYFDEDGNPLLSWRVYLLPYLGETNLYNQFHLNEPWDSPNNLPLLDKMPEIFLSRGLSPGTSLTGFQVVWSPDAYYSTLTHTPTIDQVDDGTALTIGVIETPPELAVPWTKPEDFPFDPADPFGSIRALVGDYIAVGMLDGSARAIAPTISPADAAALITWNGGEPTPYLFYYDSILSLTPQIQVTDAGGNLYRIETDVASLGSTPLGTPVNATFNIKNTGSQPLLISSIQLPEHFSLVSAPNSIAPGVTASLILSLDATIGGNFGGIVTINSNVPDQPVLKFTIDADVTSPLSLTLDNASVDENLPVGTIVGTFSTTGSNPGNTFAYALVTGMRGDDNAFFTIDSAGRLRTAASFNFENRSSYSIRVRTTEQGGSPAQEQVFVITVNDANDAPFLNPNGNPTLDTITLNVPGSSNPGTLISDLIARMAPNGGITDIDAGALQGIAINGLGGTATGTWQFTIDGGAHWAPIGSTGNADARLLAANPNTRIRYLPNTGFLGEAKLSFVAWDQTMGTNGGVANVTSRGGSSAFSANYEYASQFVVNSAPMLNPDGNPTLTDIPQGTPAANNPGTLVSDIIARMAPNGGITDINPGALKGIAVNGLSGTGTGIWQFTTDGGTTWLNFGSTGNSTARLLAADGLTRIRYTANTSFLGEAKFSFVAWDRTTGTNGGTANVSSRGGTSAFSVNYDYASQFIVNTAPVLNPNGNPTLNSIPGGVSDANNLGTLITEIISRMGPSGGITDPNPLAVKGIAINGLGGTSTGVWEYTINNGSTWASIGTTGNFDARLLAADANTRIRYRPNIGFFGEVKLAFVAWDRTSGANGGVTSVNLRGGTTAFSINYEYASLFVVNNAPVLNPTNASYLDSIPMNVSNGANIGTLVSDLIARIGPNGITDPNPAALQGIAINGLGGTSNGTWQYTTNGGVSWSAIGTTGNSNARLLAANSNTRIRFVPNLNFTGTVKLAFVAWDQTSGVNGGIANVSTRGGTTAFSTLYDYASLSIT